MKKIMVAGHISLDLTPEFNNPPSQAFSDLLRQGKLVNVGAARMTLGGAVSNTGLALHKLGANVHLTAKIGNDLFGSILQNKLSSSGCETGLIINPAQDTSYTIVLAPRGSDRAFLHNPGANHDFTYSDIPEEEIDKIDFFHFGYPTLMRKFYENSGEVFVQMYKHLKDKNIVTSLDLAAVDPSSEAAACNWEDILSRTLPYVDLFVPSIEELCFFLDRERYDFWQKRAQSADVITLLSLSEDVKPLAQAALSLGCKCILLKCGAAGMYIRSTDMDGAFAKETAKKWKDVDHFQNSYVPERILSATGAGDTSIAAFLYAAMQGMDPVTASEYAAATGACCVSTYDTTSGLLPFDTLREKIDTGWEMQHIIRP